MHLAAGRAGARQVLNDAQQLQFGAVHKLPLFDDQRMGIALRQPVEAFK
jgi:hypothetical protein